MTHPSLSFHVASPLLFALAYTPICLYLAWWLLPSYRALVIARYRAFDQWLEEADIDRAVRACDWISKVLLVTVASLLCGLVMACAIIATLNHSF